MNVSVFIACRKGQKDHEESLKREQQPATSSVFVSETVAHEEVPEANSDE